jgi:predicted enzyme related to lactoylglutathione lyase
VNEQVIGIGIDTRQPTRLISFYRDQLGLPLQAGEWEGQQYAIGTIRGLSLSIYQNDRLPETGKTASAMSFVLQFDDLRDAIAAMRRRGVAFLSIGRMHSGDTAATVRDPDGNTIHLREPVKSPASTKA